MTTYNNILIASAPRTRSQTAADSGGSLLWIALGAYPEFLIQTQYAILVGGGGTAVIGP